ncbi:MAG TPA: CRISPR-associated protein Cas4 [Anaerolinea thermolimosa]|uniref:CRISPR-associated exonuclease Cas4 n=1 Tax=Anaerolinea thermolimosa TaxID=229919 RepID=A0A3D1JG14_9CHLR|nr:CRISPR-associated protein Cas4 [Anaerolinea thermolimosa]GAP08568.1 CRISPR-associated exonuclease, Cas4 family [Anaerolinea thermolimosa]HCE17394.1 CRISPR-associated protein Cas4 [Anaerolinea thermolimosa]
MLDPYEEIMEFPFRVTDLKQWAYCPRILYYLVCLPDVQPRTYLMDVGKEVGEEEARREIRRSLRAYRLTEGRRELDVPVRSSKWGLRGKVDLVIWVDEPAPGEVIPVDFKFSHRAGEHFKLQLVAYGMLLEEMSGKPSRRGFLVEIPLRRAVEVPFTPALRERVQEILDQMRGVLESERMPPPTTQLQRCVSCEFRRFCNDRL